MSSSPLAGPSVESARPRFAHDSEARFAELLDFYGVAWQYEPVEFVLARDADGVATQAFRPDFYLPDFDVYIEMTTLNQKLVTKKNAKVRRLRALYPGVRIKVLYRRDVRHLEATFGIGWQAPKPGHDSPPVTGHLRPLASSA